MKKLISYSFILLLFLSPIFSQEKYAVLIVGDEASEDSKGIRTLNNKGNENLIFSPYGPDGDEKWYLPMEEFWFDSALLYNKLLNNGYTHNNIFLLYGKGNDYQP